jgi:hypothetical protein
MYFVIQQFIYLYYSDTKTIYFMVCRTCCVCACACALLHYWFGIRVELSTSIGSSKLSLKAILLHDRNQNYQIPAGYVGKKGT